MSGSLAVLPKRRGPVRTACSVELIRWPARAQGPHEVKVRISGLLGGAETLTRRLSNRRRALRVAKALAAALGCVVFEIDMRSDGGK